MALFGGLKIVDIFCTVMLQFYTNFRNMAWNSLYDPLPSVPFHTTANTLNAFPPGGFCKLQKNTESILMSSPHIILQINHVYL